MVYPEKKFNIRVLVAPLDWGLGHSTRCIPIVNYLQQAGCHVFIAAEKAQAVLLHREFPHLTILPLKGYRIRYSNSKRLFAFKIVWQLPKILATIRAENQWLNQIVSVHSIDLVISDNRFGLYHPTIPSIFITHQLTIISPLKPLEGLMRKLNYYYIQKFRACWVPDEAGNINLAGILSHPKKLPAMPVHYLGGISRFTSKVGGEKKYRVLIVISGPEPQRTRLEKKLLHDLSSYQQPVLLVRGLPGKTNTLPQFNQVEIVNHLPSVEMESAFLESEYVISRSGYTTIMDLVKLQKKSIVIPTPGQTEQEYLARHLHEQHWCMHVDQERFDLHGALQKAKSFPYQLPSLEMNEYKSIIGNIVQEINEEQSPG